MQLQRLQTLQTVPRKPLEISRPQVNLTIFQNNQGEIGAKFGTSMPGDTDNLRDGRLLHADNFLFPSTLRAASLPD